MRSQNYLSSQIVCNLLTLFYRINQSINHFSVKGIDNKRTAYCVLS